MNSSFGYKEDEHRSPSKYSKVGMTWSKHFGDPHDMWRFLVIDSIIRELANDPNTTPDIANRLKLTFEITDVDWQKLTITSETIWDPDDPQ